jgi:hypothetical protein
MEPMALSRSAVVGPTGLLDIKGASSHLKEDKVSTGPVKYV